MRPGGLLGLALLASGLAACGGEGRNPVAERQPELAFERNSANDVEHGERLARVLGCLGCHGEDLTGEDWSEPGFGRLFTANLTRAVPRYEDRGLANAIRTGVRGDGSEMWEMPSHIFSALTDADMRPLIAYLRSRAPVGDDHPRPEFGPLARREIAAGTWTSSAAQVRAEGRLWPPEAPGDHAAARYMVRATCSECHGLDLTGGQPTPDAAVRPDLAIAAAYSREDFRRLMRTGLAAGGRELSMMSGVARGRYAHFTDSEIDGIYDYLVARASAAR